MRPEYRSLSTLPAGRELFSDASRRPSLFLAGVNVRLVRSNDRALDLFLKMVKKP